MKPLTFCVVLILLGFSSIFAQETKKDLTERAALYYQQGKFEKAVEAAEKVVELEKSAPSKENISYANALLNLARIKQGYLVAVQNKTDDKNTSVSKKNNLYRKNSELASAIEAHLRQVLQLNENGGRKDSAQTADVKSELAALVHNYTPSGGNGRARIDEAEKLFVESLTINEQTKGKDDDKTLAVVLQLGDFYYEYVNFEKAMPFYERYIQTIEKKRGEKSPELVDALRPYAAILFTTFQEQKTADVVGKIEAITGKEEAENTSDLKFNLRSKDAVAYGTTLISSYSKSRTDFRNKLRLQGKRMTRYNLEMSPAITAVLVKVVVDETGKVIEATAEHKDAKLRAKAEKETSKWMVRPFVYQGVSHKMRGYLTYIEEK